MVPLQSFTFVCLADNQVATYVDVQELAPAAVRQHAIQLLREHASAATIEVWRDDVVWEVVGRDGVRAIAGGREAAEPASDETASTAAAV
ncbi:hypothetical protein [Caulobacter sp. UNC279MFTsu5.1]|uniref:hypothetical protein n=1 Tax=Caulobacter sp. UNC279MFTsu5.1 TaxID=1502775 RepID=UPI00037657AE|nr:hypothetical protein [Caulobacter sp. UNC279MFTsu5.1]SFI55862.1 hypothetical protein SAMN02799626_00123 [Caulobacter sp. UNC279MFTsu5.1]